jgi:hypothetical protein
LTTAGAAHIIVTPWLCIRFKISVPSTLRSTMCLAPMPVTVNGMPQPLAWNIGNVCR